MTSDQKLRIIWVKSAIGYSRRQKGTIRALGLRRLGDIVEQADTDTIRGMLRKVEHLVRVEESDPTREGAGSEGSRDGDAPRDGVGSEVEQT